MTIAQKLKGEITSRGILLKDVAAHLDMSRQRLQYRFKANAFREDELKKIAAFIGGEYVSKFVFRDLNGKRDGDENNNN